MRRKTYIAKKVLTWRGSVGTRERNRKPELLKSAWVVFLFCFIAGIVIANMVGKGQLGSFGIWNAYFIEKFKVSDIRADSLFFYVLEERLPIILLLLVLVVTNWAITAGIIFVGWQGFASGFMMAASIMNFGGKGMLLVFTAIFPQYLIYIPVYIAYLYLAGFFRERVLPLKGQGENRNILQGKARVYLVLLGLCLLVLAGYIIGIFLESYVNPYLLKKVLKIF